MWSLPISSPSQSGALFAAKQREGSDVRNLLCFAEEEVTQVMKPSHKNDKKTKNYVQRNMKMLRIKQEQIRKRSQEKEAQREQEQEKDKKLKENKFQHITPRIFKDKTTEICNNCSTSTIQNLTFHKNYGHVPPYILKFRIEQANKENKQNLPLRDVDKSQEVLTSKYERMHTLDNLLKEESRLTELLNKMPFGFQSNQSIEKRKKLEMDLKWVRMEKLKLLS